MSSIAPEAASPLPATLATRRLLLRQPTEADIPALVRGLGNYKVARWLGRVPHPYVPRHTRRWLPFQRQAHQDGRDLSFVIVLAGRPRAVIGGLGAHDIDGARPVVGYWLAEPHWGRGYAGEALTAVLSELRRRNPAARPQATARAGNARSIAVLQRAGLARQPGRFMQWNRALGRKVAVLRFLAPPKCDVAGGGV